MGLPYQTGTDHDTVACVFPATPETEVGAFGTVKGVTGLDALEVPLSPAVFVATTVNVYAVPFVNPVTTHDVDAVVHIAPPGDAVVL
jgi:hypothetical protein